MYGKIFASMFKGSLYGKWEAIVTFTAMIVLADKEGEVDMTPEALSAHTSIPLHIITKGIEQLEAPDPTSRTPDEEGRRIVRVSDSRTWGWRITNHAHYRAMRTAEERRDYFRQYKRDARAEARAASTGLNRSPPVSTESPQSPPIAVSSKQEAVGSKQDAVTLSLSRARKIVRDFAEEHGALKWQPLLGGYAEGLGTEGGKAATLQQLAQACLEANTLGGDMPPRRFRRILAQVMEPRSHGPGRSNQRDKLKGVM